MFAPLQIGLDQIGSIASIETVALKDLFLGFFAALAFKRGRVSAILDRVTPSDGGSQATAQRVQKQPAQADAAVAATGARIPSPSPPRQPRQRDPPEDDRTAERPVKEPPKQRDDGGDGGDGKDVVAEPTTAE